MNLTYNYDATGNILHMKNEDSSSIKEEWNYTYDPLDRLLTAAGGPPGENYSLSYQYDGTGNRTQLNNTTYTYNEMNELLSLSDPSGNSTFTYDIHGNLITKDDGQNLWEYSYDYENRLQSVKKNGQVTEEYSYDGDGKRIKKIDSDSERIYIYSGLTVLYEMNTTTDMEAVYFYGPTGRIAKRVNDVMEYYNTDHLGSTRLVTSENGVTTEEIMYKPFGEQLNETEERYTYNQKELDETGFYYYGARYYDPVTGRFLTRDPLTGKKESPQSLNRYVYCLNNPLTYIDPAGTNSSDPRQAVEDIFNTLSNLNPETLIEIQEKVDKGEMTALDALEMIIELLGFTVTWKDAEHDMLGVEINGSLILRVQLKEDLKTERGNPVYGLYRCKTASLDFQKTGNVGDLALIFLHEASHAVLEDFGLGIPKEEQIIYSVEFSYMIASRLTCANAPYSKTYMRHVVSQAFIRDPTGIYQPSIPEILERWSPQTGYPIS